MCWASAPGTSSAIVATTWRGRSVCSSAQSAIAPRLRSQPSRAPRRTSSSGGSPPPARRSSRNEPRRFCSTSSRASSTATSVSDATAARCRYSAASPAAVVAPSSMSTAPTDSSPDAIGISAARPRGLCARRSCTMSATYRRSSGSRSCEGCPAGAMTAVPRRGMMIATDPPTASAASSATRSRPSPASTASTIRRCSPLSRSTRVAAVGAATRAFS